MDKKFAVFVDGENISAKYYESVIKEICLYGEILIKKVYGDRATPSMKTWKTVLANEPATFCNQPRLEKNATDAKIMINATEIMCNNPNINAFCIASSDADFCILAHHLRENGKFVIGMGEEKSKPNWQEACNKFVKLESLTNKETGILLYKPKHFGLVENERGVFHFSLNDIDGDKKRMMEGAQVTFKILKEPDPTQLEKKDQRGKAANVRLVA